MFARRTHTPPGFGLASPGDWEMRECDSAYDTRAGGAVTALLTALRDQGRTVDTLTTGAVRVDGDLIESDKFDRAAMAWDGTENGLADLGWD